MSDSTKIVECTEANFATSIASGLCLVDFWAPWCGPCQAMTPVMTSLAETYAGRVNFFKANVDELETVAETYSIRGIPAFFIFRDGKKVDEVIGAVPANTLTAVLDKHLQAPAMPA